MINLARGTVPDETRQYGWNDRKVRLNIWREKSISPPDEKEWVSYDLASLASIPRAKDSKSMNSFLGTVTTS